MPDILGNYTLEKKIGAGGMADVFLARGPAGICVVKRPHPHLCENAEFVRMFLDEAALVAQLNHPGIARVFDLGHIAGSYYLPWGDLPKYPELIPAEDLVSIDVAYDRSELSVNDTVNVSVRVALNEPGTRSESAIIDLGLPPGFTVEAEDLAALVAYYNDVPQDYPFAQIQRYELTGRQIILYTTNLSEGNPLEFSYRLRAKYPLKAKSPASLAYDYYTPERQGDQRPTEIVVNE